MPLDMFFGPSRDGLSVYNEGGEVPQTEFVPLFWRIMHKLFGYAVERRMVLQRSVYHEGNVVKRGGKISRFSSHVLDREFTVALKAGGDLTVSSRDVQGLFESGAYFKRAPKAPASKYFAAANRVCRNVGSSSEILADIALLKSLF